MQRSVHSPHHKHIANTNSNECPTGSSPFSLQNEFKVDLELETELLDQFVSNKKVY